MRFLFARIFNQNYTFQKHTKIGIFPQDLSHSLQQNVLYIPYSIYFFTILHTKNMPRSLIGCCFDEWAIYGKISHFYRSGAMNTAQFAPNFLCVEKLPKNEQRYYNCSKGQFCTKQNFSHES